MKRQWNAISAGSAVDAAAQRGRQRGRLGLAIATLLAAATAIAVTAAPAFAERAYDSQITGLDNPWGLAIDSSDDVWISQPESGEGVIAKYDAYPSQTKIGEQTGEGHYGPTYIRSLAVDGTNGDLYVADSGAVVVHVFEGTGGYVGDISHGFGGGYVYVAADNSGGASNGDVYVASTCCSLQKFDGAGNPVSFSGSAGYISGNEVNGTPAGSFGQVWNVATDSNGNVYVVDQGKRVVDEFEADGEFVQEFTGAGAPTAFSGNLTGVAVDPTDEDVLVVDSGNDVVDEFEADGAYAGQLTGASTTFASLGGGIAVNSSGYVYVADSGNGVVDIFTPSVVLPKVTYEGVTDATHTSGTIHATVDPNGGGEVSSCLVEYGPTSTFGQTTPCSPSPPFAATTQISAPLLGLTAETACHYRVVVSDENGTKKGAAQTFTPQAVYSLNTDPPSNLTTGSATLNGSFEGDGNDTHYQFEYVDFEGYAPTAPNPYAAGELTPLEDAGSGSGIEHVSATAHLAPYVEYHYRVVATNSFGTTYGQDQAFFSAPPVLPTIDSSEASQIGAEEATLGANLIPGFGGTIVRFEYGTSSSYGTHTFPTEPTPPDDAVHAVQVPISGLAPGTLYHFRAVATNFTGSSYGSDETFTTEPNTPPVATPPSAGPSSPPSSPAPQQSHPVKCKKGFVKRNGRCTRQRRPRHHSPRAHHKGNEHHGRGSR